ncbi:glycerol-3-phosphate 1-O-acyltransferase PlsY [bacterium]|nr:glycerol-3-phosphate 1-O-acyltransferase PlsY [bacterium]
MSVLTVQATGVLLGFFCGSLLPGYWIGKFVFKKDICQEGSGNIGATNAFRVLGPAAGTVVLCLDVAKGALAVFGANRLGAHGALAGLAAILGHTFSPFLSFRGGKGVATGLGVFLVLAVKPTLAALAVWVLVFAIGRRVSPASCLAAITLGAGMPVWSADVPLIAVTEATILLVLLRHRENLRRLFQGEEKKLF